MKKYILKYTLGILLILGVGMVSCDDRDDELKELNLDRNLTPYKLEAEITNVVNLSLKWQAPKGANGYIIEIYADDLEFKEENFRLMDEVLEKNFECLDLLGNTQYSARVKAVSVDNNDSNWATVAFKTGFKSIMLPFIKGDITKTSIKFRWPAGTDVTGLVLSVPSGDEIVRRALTEAELASGIVDFTDLQSNVKHTLKLYNGEKLIGEASETTLVDGAIPLTPNDDLKAKLEAAEEGDVFELAAGTYLPEGVVVNITKNVTIMGAIGAEPIIHGQFLLADPAGISFKNVVLDGKEVLDYVVKLPDVSSGNFGDILIEGCAVRNYLKALVAGDKMKAEIASIKISNSIVTNIKTSGSDLIDFRVGYVAKIIVENSTFNNVAPARCFIRLDDSSVSFLEKPIIIAVENCTFYKSVNASDQKGVFYVRYKNNAITMKNNIFSNTIGVLGGDTKSIIVECENNNYFEAPNFLKETSTSTAAKVFDTSGNHTTTNPQFEDAANGNFKTVISGKGDPRWYQ